MGTEMPPETLRLRCVELALEAEDHFFDDGESTDVLGKAQRILDWVTNTDAD